MDEILQDCMDHYVVVYLDDPLDFSEDVDKHFENSGDVLIRLRPHAPYVEQSMRLFVENEPE